MKSYTDIEQSKVLSKILSLESADMFYRTDGSVKLMWEHLKDIPLTTPCCSLSALLGLMPFHIIENNNRFKFYQVKGFNKQGETYRFGYKTNYPSFLFETSWYNNVVDAAFEMICWLKENEKI